MNTDELWYEMIEAGRNALLKWKYYDRITDAAIADVYNSMVLKELELKSLENKQPEK